MTAICSVHPSISAKPLPLDADDLPTVCVLCSHNCGLRIDVRNGQIHEIRGDDRNPATTGYLCNKAFSIGSYVNHAQRVQHPLRRCADGSFEPISWETAIAEIAEKLAAIRTNHSPRAIALVGVGGQANHLAAPYALGFLRSLGSRRWFNAFAQEKTQHALVDQWLFSSSPCTFLHSDQHNSRYMLVLGTNPRISNRGHNATESFRAFSEDPTRTLVVVDPRETETTRQANAHLRVRPGTDAYLLLALAATILSEDLYDREFVEKKVVGFDELRAALHSVDVSQMAEHCGLTTQEILETARGFAAAETASIFYDLGIEQTIFSTLNSYLIRVLLVLTGNVGRRGGNVFYETLLPPTVDPSLRRDPETAIASGIPAIPALGNFGMFSPTLVPEEIMIEHTDRIRAVIVESANPYLSYSDTQRWREARKRLELLVVIDPAMTETALDADYVLPATVGYEKWEMANFPKGYPQVFLQLRPPVVPPPAEALPEPEIYVRLAEAMNLFGPPPAELVALAEAANNPDGAAQFIMTAQMLAKQSPNGGRDAQTQILFWTYRTLGAHLPSPAIVSLWLQCHINALQRPASILRTLGSEWEAMSPFEIAAELWRRTLAHPEGFEFARIDEERNLEDHLNFPDGKIRLAPKQMLDEISIAVEEPPQIDPELPLVMASGLRTRWTANTIHRDPSWRKGSGANCPLTLSPADAAKLGIANGETVRLVTSRAAVTMPAQIDPKMLPGHVSMPNGFGLLYPKGEVLVENGVNQNQLTNSADRDPFTGIPYHRYVPCRVERLSATE